MTYKIEKTERKIRVRQTSTQKTFLDAEWIKSPERQGELKLIINRPDGKRIVTVISEKQKGILQFTWNENYTFVSSKDKFRLTNHKFFKKIWKLELTNSNLYYKNGFIKYISQNTDFQHPLIKVDEDIIHVLKKMDKTTLELAISVHLVFDKPWIEVVF